LLFRRQYRVNMAQYADLTTIWAARSFVTNLVILPLLARHLADTSLVLLAILTTSTAYVTTAFGSTVLYLLLVGLLFALNWPIEKITNALLSKLVSADEIGTTFSFLAVISKIIEFVAKPFYGFLYRATVDRFPGAFLFVSTGCLCLAACLMISVRRGLARRGRDAQAGRQI
jgi:hypothetical protein